MKIVQFKFMLFEIITYVLIDEPTNKCVIVDPGMMNAEEENAISDFIKRNSLTVTQIINTHLHIDHIYGDNYARDQFKAPVTAHKGDEELLRTWKHTLPSLGIAEEAGEITVDEYLEDGDVIRVGESELKVINVPGHSPGSIALYNAKDGFVLTGDILFAGTIGRTDFPGGKHQQLLDGIRKKLFSLPKDTVVFPAHGSSSTIGREEATNPFFN